VSILTDKGMQAKPTAKDQWLTQPFARGSGVFVGRITPKGERLFYFRYTDSTRNRPFYPIGPYHQKGRQGLTLADAYTKACELAELYRSGIKDLHTHFHQKAIDEAKAIEHQRQNDADQQAQALLDRERRISVRQLFAKWKDVELKSHKRTDGKRVGRKDDGQYTHDQFNRHIFPKLGDLPASAIKKGDVLSVLDPLKSQGKSRTCNVLFTDLKQMFNFAVAREIIPTNPMATLTKRDAGGAENERDSFLATNEIIALSKQLPTSKLALRSQYAVWLMLSTACRVSELIGAKWSDVDLKGCKLHLEETKNQRPHDVHLSKFSVQFFKKLEKLKQLDEHGNLVPWVFPNRKLNGPVCNKSLNKQIKDRQKGDGHQMQHRSKSTTSLVLDGGIWKPHDLRRTAATCMAQLGFSADVIDECLNHKIQGRSTRIYIRDRREKDQAKAFEALGQHISDLVDGKKTISNISSFRRKMA
jgi:integrase